jgi:hypothetical protein
MKKQTAIKVLVAGVIMQIIGAIFVSHSIFTPSITPNWWWILMCFFIETGSMLMIIYITCFWAYKRDEPNSPV